MFEHGSILPWQRRQNELLKERVRSISLIRRNAAPSYGGSLHDTARPLSHDWGFDLQTRRGQAPLPFDLPPAA